MTPFNKRRGEGSLKFENGLLIIKGTWKDDNFEKGTIEIFLDNSDGKIQFGKSSFLFDGTFKNNFPFEGKMVC